MGTTLYHFAMRLAVGFFYDRIMNNKADIGRWWYQPKGFEKRIYNWLNVKNWKGIMPSYEPELFDPQKHTWNEIAQAMCQAELVHETIILLSFVPILFAKLFLRHAGGVVRARNAGGNANVDDILARLEEGGEIFHEFACAYLRGLGFSAALHSSIKIVERHALAEVVHVLNAVQSVMEANVLDISLFEMLLGDISYGTAADDVICHNKLHSAAIAALSI
jgi:hypothetical protein